MTESTRERFRFDWRLQSYLEISQTCASARLFPYVFLEKKVVTHRVLPSAIADGYRTVTMTKTTIPSVRMVPARTTQQVMVDVRSRPPFPRPPSSYCIVPHEDMKHPLHS